MLELDPYRKLPDPGETAFLEVRPTVAIIGAGLSGMVAARLLAERGYMVTVFDKGRKPGGRSSTRQDGTFAFDHGCQYFTARDARFQRYVEAWKEQGIVSEWNGQRASCVNGTINLVSDDVSRYVGVPGMNAIALHLSLGIDVRNGIEITGIQQNEDKTWTLRANEDITETFELVIVSTPAPQAEKLLTAVPNLAAKISSTEMLPCWCVMVAFEYDLDTTFDATYFSNSPLVWAANNSSKPGRSQQNECWVLQASPSWSIAHLEEEREQIADQLVSAFFDATGHNPVSPSYVKAHRWRFASPVKPMQQECIWSANEWIGTIGDWCHSARMEGAFISGLSIAERIIDDCPRSRQFVK